MKIPHFHELLWLSKSWCFRLKDMNKYRIFYGLITCLLMVSCSTSASRQGKTPLLDHPSKSIIVPDCHAHPCMVSADAPGIVQFIDTWNNIHLFQSFDYNISNPATVARYYDFVW